MTKDIFAPTSILLPKGIPMEQWAVIACDQFSSERDYWQRVKQLVGDSPSTYNLIIPEAYLDEINEDEEIDNITSVMDDYIGSEFLQEINDSFVYVERTLSDGRVREGLVGAVDLEAYDFSSDTAAIRASEGTVLDRLPPRIRIRCKASMELPHIITFIDDSEDFVMSPLRNKKKTFAELYSFTLMQGGGHIKGMLVNGEDARDVVEAIRTLHKKSDMLMVMGDGNHSLAAAKVYWDDLKGSLSEEQRLNHPARHALVELNNVYDDAIDFEAIHRIIFDTNPQKLISAFKEKIEPGTDYVLRWVTNGKSGEIGVAAGCIGDMLSVMQEFLDEYSKETGCRIDYIHGEDSVMNLSQCETNLGLILPAMEKSEFFATVASRGVFPKKSFSVGHANDKRYYLECRLIK
ncbi:MAG: DUF1015 domain-containing protein [Oscillospiraceae bacterium]|nr:DUF1015 domain-containing protein [Oscillospiraceae bacterium]